MYRSYRSCCHCNNNICNKKDEELMEDSCNCIENTIKSKDMCECGFDEEDNLFPTNPMYAQSYVPWQTMNNTFTPCVGLKMGTIFPELVSPYMPGQSMEEIKFIKETNSIGKGCNKC